MTDAAGRLEPYRAKRDFGKTGEPAGEARPPGGARFVIQEHHARRLHWDLRLERDGVLASWAVPKGLPESPGTNHFAARTEDHPLEYIDFHGEIPAGQYGAGEMTIWDRGTYETLKWEPRKVEVALHGERLEARYALFAIGREAEPKDWMIHRMDPPADPDREPMPDHVQPMLPRPGSLPSDGRGFAHEIRWEGLRAIAYSEPGVLRLESGGDVTDRFPELGRLNRALSSHAAVLDGMIVGLDGSGRPNPEAVARRAQATSPTQLRRMAKELPVTYVVFDLLWLDGHSLLARPYADRRERLTGLGLAGERWQTPDHVVGHGAEVLEAAVGLDLRGIVAKRLDSPYRPGRRSPAWIEVVAGGDAPDRPGPVPGKARVRLGGREVELTDLGELVGEAADYYAGIARVMLPHLDGRALAVDPPEIRSGLARPGAPDRVVFELAPATAAGCEVALRLQGMFEHLGLECLAKTSGAGGLELHLPVAGATFPETGRFARMVAELLAGDDPELVVAGPGPAGDGRVRVDWSANAPEGTTPAAYSLRAGRGVSTPVDWDELDDPAALDFTPAAVLDRVAREGDLFAPVLSLRQGLPRL